MQDFSKPWCYWVDAEQPPPGNGKPGYIPSIVFEGDAGHYPMLGNGPHATPWYWGETVEQAQEICAAANEKMGVSAVEAERIVDSSIGQQLRDGRTREELWAGTQD